MTPEPTAVECTHCGLKDARNFITSIVYGVTTQLNLCQDCFKMWEASSGHESPTMEGACCDYCGGPAAGGSLNNSWELAATGRKFSFTCMPCMHLKLEEMRRYVSEMETVGTPLPDSMEGMIDFTRELDARIRRRLPKAGE